MSKEKEIQELKENISKLLENPLIKDLRHVYDVTNSLSKAICDKVQDMIIEESKKHIKGNMIYAVTLKNVIDFLMLLSYRADMKMGAPEEEVLKDMHEKIDRLAEHVNDLTEKKEEDDE